MTPPQTTRTPGHQRPQFPWVREQWAFLVVLAGVAGALLYLLAEPGHWARGTAAIAIAVLVGGVLRLVLSAARAGLLVVRSRAVDVVCYAVLGGLILAMDLRLHK